MPDNQFMWRPKEWPTGTKVHVQAAIGAVEVAPEVWGQRTYTGDFSIGSRVISTVDVQKFRLTYRAQGLKVVPVTTGKSTPDGKPLTRGKRAGRLRRLKRRPPLHQDERRERSVGFWQMSRSVRGLLTDPARCRCCGDQ
jgi:hypothetical protein